MAGSSVADPAQRIAWDLPGGHVGQNELPNNAVRRELDEELGIQVEAGDALELQTLTLTGDLTISTWLVTRWAGEVANRALDEHDQLRWFTLADMAAVNLAAPEIIDVCAAALISANPTTVVGDVSAMY